MLHNGSKAHAASPLAGAMSVGGVLAVLCLVCVPGMAQYILKEIYDNYLRSESLLLASW
jgi:hypothetical protein